MINLFKTTRYFIITFQWEMSKGRSGTGELSHASPYYPNRDAICQSILQQRKTVEKVVITNVNELSKKDFNHYCQK